MGGAAAAAAPEGGALGWPPWSCGAQRRVALLSVSLSWRGGRWGGVGGDDGAPAPCRPCAFGGAGCLIDAFFFWPCSPPSAALLVCGWPLPPLLVFFSAGGVGGLCRFFSLLPVWRRASGQRGGQGPGRGGGGGQGRCAAGVCWQRAAAAAGSVGGILRRLAALGASLPPPPLPPPHPPALPPSQAKLATCFCACSSSVLAPFSFLWLVAVVWACRLFLFID